jgi:hypothetical protein
MADAKFVAIETSALMGLPKVIDWRACRASPLRPLLSVQRSHSPAIPAEDGF